MIRRDYVLSMIEQCIQALTRSLRSMEQRQFEEAEAEIEQTVRHLVGLDLTQVTTRSETDLLGALLTGEPTQALRQKCMLLVALLHRAGAIHEAQGKVEPSRGCYLKALNVQLDVLLREGPFDFPEFVPRVEALVRVLHGTSLPMATTGALMQYYETVGQFAKAEDALFTLLEQQPSPEGLRQFGTQFYERIGRQSDEALELGELPKAEVQAGLAEFTARFGVGPDFEREGARPTIPGGPAPRLDT